MAVKSIKDLEEELAATKEPIDRIDTLNSLAWELVYLNTERANQLAQQALRSSRNNNTTGYIYEKGAGLSLRTLGEIAKLRSDYNNALSFLLEASTILDALPDLENWLIVSDSLSWVYLNIGDISMAFETLLKALKVARRNTNTAQEANLLNTLGALYGECGDKLQSIDTLKRALEFFEGTKNDRKRCIAFNNLAMTQFEILNYDMALENAAKSVGIARQLDSADLLATALDTTGQIYLARQEYSKAELYFRQAQEFYLEFGDDPDEIRLNLARAAIGQNRLDEAEAVLLQSLKTIGTRGSNRFKYQIHELLARIYEEKNDLQTALEQYKLFHSLKSQFYYNEDIQRRLTNLIVLQEVETTQIDAEIYHLKNLALRKEVSVYRQAVAEMEILATTDSLTGLLNRRHLITLARYTFDTAQASGKPLVVLMIDVDDFKKVNDNYGHPTGDLVLREVCEKIRSTLRAGDILGRYGGEEFVAILPATSLFEGQQVAERIVKNIAEHATPIERHDDIHVTISIGIAQIEPGDVNFDNLLKRSDKALYAAKRAGKNRACLAKSDGSS